MNYPLLSDYIEAIKASEDNFEQLKHLRPVLGADGEPVFSSGNFAVVFKMKDEQTGKLYAVKCFTKEQEGRAMAYRKIAKELNDVSSHYLISIRYLDKELFVDTDQTTKTEFPVLLMDWVEGQTLDKYLRENLDDKYTREMLAYRFSQMAQWLILQPFAHGDLKPDNILVRKDGSLVLVDYDGMYVPAMKGQEARELGSLDFRHPKRASVDFNGHIDDFSLASILLSLKTISLQPSLLKEYGASDRLLFSEKDYHNLSECKVLGALKPLLQDAELATLYSLFILALSQNNLSRVSFRLFNLPIPDKSQYEEESLFIESNPDDYENGHFDDYGVEYSSDGMRLLSSANEKLWDYTIKQGTKIIEDGAFENWKDFGGPHSVIIPDSVIKIGIYSFYGCNCLEYVDLPSHLVEIGEGAFFDSYINTIKLNEGLKRIGNDAFRGSRLISITIPSTVNEIGNSAFKNCQKLVSIVFSNSSVKLGEEIFDGCKELKSICVPYGTISIFKNLLPDFQDIIEEDDDEVFPITDGSDILKTEVTNDDLATAWIGDSGVKYSADRKRLLKSSGLGVINVRKGTIVICDSAFYKFNGDDSFLSINIPEGVIVIGNHAFTGCNIKSLYIPKTVKKISKNAFYGCNNLTSIIVDSQNVYYDSRNNCNAIIETETNTLISGCKTSFIPQGVNIINDSAFKFCEGLTSVIIPKSVIRIEKEVFYGCSGLTSIVVESDNPVYDSRENCNAIIESNTNTLLVGCKNTIVPNTVTAIGNRAFNCSGPSEIVIPNSIKSIGNRAFTYCFHLTSITLSESVTNIGESVFNCCFKLASIFIPIGSKKRFEELLPEYMDKLVEKELGG